MDPASWIGLFFVVGITVTNSLLVVCERATIEISQTAQNRMARSDDRAVRRLKGLLDNRYSLWLTYKLAISVGLFVLVCITIGTFGVELGHAMGSQVAGQILALGLATTVSTTCVLVIPRIVSQHDPLGVALRLLWLIMLAHFLYLPLSSLLQRVASPTRDSVWGSPSGTDAAAVEAVERARGGAVDASGMRMITKVVQLGERIVREVMTPRPGIVSLSVDTPLRGALDVAHQHGLSRLPVYEGNLDTIVGVVHVRDCLAGLLEPDQPASLRHLARKPLFVPDSKRADQLLREMQADKLHLAVVVNEYGDTAGLITIEDLLEEIVGEIDDEHDAPSVPIEVLGPQRAAVDASLPISDLNDELGLALAGRNAYTVGGLALSAFGRVPAVGESVRVDGALLRIRQVVDTRITRLEVIGQDSIVNAG